MKLLLWLWQMRFYQVHFYGYLLRIYPGQLEVRKQVASYPAMKLLATTLQAASATICFCSCKHDSS